jgi:dTDP-4-dehydrorhamnose 3,5-epimerase
VSAAPENPYAEGPGGGGARLLRSRVFEDDRGCFVELWREDAPIAREVGARFVQDNLSVSRAGVLRGLHWQDPPHAQGKLVLCLRGKVFDAVVDLRESSPAYGRATTFTLEGIRHAGERGGGAAEDAMLLWVPPGFAHGFLALEEGSVVAYKVTAPWAPGAERTLRFDDPVVGIRWPAAAGSRLVSAKDRAGMTWSDYAAHPSFGKEGTR